MKSKWIEIIRTNCYFGSLLLLAAAMPLSKALLSISLALLFVSWLITSGLKERITILTKRKSLWFFLIGYLLVIVGLLYSENTSRNLFLLGSIKISLVILPIVIATFPPLSKKQLKCLLIAFTVANLVATFISTLILFQVIKYEITDTRQISIFVESIRFALLVAINILLLAYTYKYLKNIRWIAIVTITIIWFLLFLCLLQALTGLFAVLVTVGVLFLVFYKKVNRIWRYIIIASFTISIVSVAIYINSINSDYHKTHKVDLSRLDISTINGNHYQHDIIDTTRINGNLVGIYICETELRQEWAKHSKKQFDSLDQRGYYPIKKTLIYYLSSMGLRKDSLGMTKLDDRDYRNIECGYTNKMLAGIGLKSRIYDLVREFDTWNRTGKPDGSVTIRLNAIVNGWKVFIRTPWFGTGYGDINDDIQAQFEIDNKVFGEPMRQNPHNQFFTVLIGSGIIGFIIFCISVILPGIIEKKYQSFIFLVAFCITILSFMSDDTLERMVGCVIMAFFFSIALYSVPEEI